MEPEWSDEDRAYALALTDYDANRCPGCGGQLDETTDPKIADRVHHTKCHRCVAIAKVRDAYHEEHKDPAGNSDADLLLWHAEPVPIPQSVNGARRG